MKAFIFLIVILLCLFRPTYSMKAFGVYLAVAEVEKTHLDMGGTVGMYEVGLNLSQIKTFYFINLESGFSNLDSDICYLGNIGVGPRYLLIKGAMDIFLELGSSYFGYVRETYYNPPSFKNEFIHTFPVYLAVGATLFDRIPIGINKYFDSAIVWKFQVGYRLIRF